MESSRGRSSLPIDALRLSGLGALGALTLAFGLVLGGANELRSSANPSLLLVLSACLVQGLTLLLALALRPARGGAQHRKVLALILIAGGLARIAALNMPAELSDDIYRYRWEARVIAAGENPYEKAPSDPSLRELRDELWEPVNHKDVPAIYPPLTLALFTAIALLGSEVLGFKLALLSIELALIALTLWSLRKSLARRQITAALILAWHPLPILEIAGQGHFEPLPLLALLAALLARRHKAPVLSGLLTSLAVAAKYIPLLLLSALARRRGPSWSSRRFLIAFALSLLILLAPLWLKRSAGSLGRYGSSWRFNSPGFDALDQLWRRSGAARMLVTRIVQPILAEPEQDLRFHENWLSAPARLTVLAILVGLLIVQWRQRRPPVLAAQELFLTLLLLSPVVHPWYGLWLWPWLALRPRSAPLLLTLLLPLSYEVLLRYQGSPETWSEANWIRVLIFTPPLLMLLLEAPVTRRPLLRWARRRWRALEAAPADAA